MALKTLSAAALAVASGPGDVEVTFQDHDGFYIRHSSSDGSALTDWMPWKNRVPVLLTLDTGQYLHLRGRGTASVDVIDATAV